MITGTALPQSRFAAAVQGKHCSIVTPSTRLAHGVLAIMKGMSKHPDVLIIGGGVIGLTTAYYLTERGTTVAVVDKGDLGREASWAGAGILTPAKVRDDLPPWEYLKALGSQLYPDLSARLKEQ